MGMMRKEKESFTEFIYIKDGQPTYCKMRILEKETYGFWIPAISSWFWPCEKDQDKLHKMFIQTEEFKLDTSPIKLKRSWHDITPEDEKPIEERTPTKEEKEELEWF